LRPRAGHDFARKSAKTSTFTAGNNRCDAGVGSATAEFHGYPTSVA